MSRQHLGILLLITALSALPLGAQNVGEITGTVADSTNAVIAGATVIVTSSATNQVRRVATNDAGAYSVPFLMPGLYDVRAETSGFKAGARKGVELQVGAIARIDFALEVGEMTQQVEVSGGAPLMATETVALGTVIENKRVIELPLNGRNYLQLVTLSPNVTTEGGGGGGSGLQGGARSQVSLSIAGQRLEFNRYTLDGIENTDPNFNSYIIQPSVDAIQEFKVQTGVYSAEFGRGASQINVTTKSGTNQYHGALFEFLRNSALDARQWLQSTGAKNPFRRNQYGFTLGGPIQIPKVFNGKDRLFFMSNFEQLRDRTTSQLSASVATAAMRTGDFSNAGKNIFDPLSRVFNSAGIATSAMQFPGNVIPQSRLNSASLKLVSYYPVPTAPGQKVVAGNFLRNASLPSDSDQFNQRVDWIENSKSNWFGRFGWGHDFQQNSATVATDASHVETVVRQGMLSNTRILSASTVNQARFGFNQFNNDLAGYFANGQNVGGALGIVGLFTNDPLAYGLPAIGLGGGVVGFGGVTPWITRNTTFQFMDDVSIVRGRHSIKIGGEVRRDRFNQFGNQKVPGEFLFDGQSTFDPANRGATGFVFADFMLGSPSSSARVMSMANAMFRSSSYYAYIQDDWRITPKLTVNLGVRYENSRPWYDKYSALVNIQLFDPGVGPQGLLPASQTKTPILTRPGATDFYQGVPFRFSDGQLYQAGNQMGRAGVNPDNNNFAPRLGFAYSPTKSWTIRAGAGIFYLRDIGNAVFDISRNLAGRDLFIPNLETRNTTLTDPFAQERASAQCTGWTGPCLVAPQILGNTQAGRTPYATQWLLNIQRQLTESLVLEVGYQGNQGHKLGRFRFYNQPVLKTGPTDTRTVAQRQPWPAFGRIELQNDSTVSSNYHAVSSKVTQRFSKGLTYLFGFTWSKAIDTGSAIRNNSGDVLMPINSYDFTKERGLSQFHVGRRLVASFLYELPFGPGKPLANQRVIGKIVGGWQLGGIFTLADGAPLTVAQLGDTAALNTLGNRPDATGISAFPTNGQTAQMFWNIAAINATSPDLNWRTGNMGRNTLLKPGTRQADLSLARNIKIYEGHTLNIRFEAFNSANHPNWNAPSSDARSPSTFGVITTARTMRQLQFALKYVF